MPIKTLTCPSCGAPIGAEGAMQPRFCGYCGVRLSVEERPHPHAVDQLTPAAVRQEPERLEQQLERVLQEREEREKKASQEQTLGWLLGFGIGGVIMMLLGLGWGIIGVLIGIVGLALYLQEPS